MAREQEHGLWVVRGRGRPRRELDAATAAKVRTARRAWLAGLRAGREAFEALAGWSGGCAGAVASGCR